MGKNAAAYNTTSQEGNTTEAQETMNDMPMIIMPPGPVIIEEHDKEDNGEKAGEEKAKEDFYDHDSGEEKVAAMIAGMQKGMIGEGENEDTEESENETEINGDANGDQIDTQNAQDDDDQEDIVDNDGGSNGEENDKNVIDDEDETQNEAESENDEDSNGGEADAIGKGDDGDEANGQETLEPLATPEPDSEKAIASQAGTVGKDVEPEIHEDSSGGEADAIGKVHERDKENGQETSEPSATPAEPDNEEETASPTATPVTSNVENQDTEPENEEDPNGGDGGGQPDEDASGEGAVDEDMNGQQTAEPQATPEPGDEENITSLTATPSAASHDEIVEATTSPSPVPSSMATEDQIQPTIIQPPDVIPPKTESAGDTPTDPTDSPSVAPSNMPLDINQVSHEDAPQPHTSTTGSTDTEGSSSGALCRHPSGLVQQFSCKITVGIQSHPFAFSAVFLVLSIWGCCLCRRLFKGRNRRDEHGEYREIAAQYDDMLFQDTFDDNYSTSFADDRSADGSISEEEDDWTKGPNIELSEVPHKENDNLTLEEMNG